MSRNAQRLVTAAFLLFLGLALAATLLREEETYSFFENRTLAQKPVYSAQADGDGSYFSGWERYLSDHAAGRNTLLRLKTQLDLALGRPVKTIHTQLARGKKLLRQQLERRARDGILSP